MTSKLLESGVIDFSNLNGEKGLPTKSRMNPGYYNSKLANAYFAAELAKRIENTGVNIYMVCPGFTYTGLFRNVKRSWFHYIIFSPFALMFLRTANQVNIRITMHSSLNNFLLLKNVFYYKINIHRVRKRYCIVRQNYHYLRKADICIATANFTSLRRI